MALEHEFFMLTLEITNKIMDNEIIVFYQNNRKSAVCIQDDLILANLNAFKDINTVTSYPNKPTLSKGLNYYGYTIFMPNSLSQLLVLLKKISKGNEFSQLIALCEEAHQKNVAVLHYGI